MNLIENVLKNKLKIIIAIIAGAFISPFVFIPIYENIELKMMASSLKKVAANELKNPESARFKNLELKSSLTSRTSRASQLWEYITAWGFKEGLEEWTNRGEVFLCGEINGHNEFGGYAGFRTFYARPNPPEAFIDSNSSQHSVLNTFAKSHCDNERFVLMKIDD